MLEVARLGGMVVRMRYYDDLRHHSPHVGNWRYVITFNTGERRLFDVTKLYDAPAFAPLKDESTLKGYAVEYDTITWQGGAIDIAPEAAYDMSYEYPMSA